jgi:hypothetical protein
MTDKTYKNRKENQPAAEDQQEMRVCPWYWAESNPAYIQVKVGLVLYKHQL